MTLTSILTALAASDPTGMGFTWPDAEAAPSGAQADPHPAR